LLSLLRGPRSPPLHAALSFAHHDHPGVAPLAAKRAWGSAIEDLDGPRHARTRFRGSALPPVPAFAVALRRRRAAVLLTLISRGRWPAKQALLGAIAARVPAVVATLQLHMDLPLMALRCRAQQRIIGRGVGALRDGVE
jgi:hypothetical protein